MRGGMRIFAAKWNRVLAFFHKPPLDAEMDAEMAAHVEMAVEENMRRGMDGRGAEASDGAIWRSAAGEGEAA